MLEYSNNAKILTTTSKLNFWHVGTKTCELTIKDTKILLQSKVHHKSEVSAGCIHGLQQMNGFFSFA